MPRRGVSSRGSGGGGVEHYCGEHQQEWLTASTLVVQEAPVPPPRRRFGVHVCYSQIVAGPTSVDEPFRGSRLRWRDGPAGVGPIPFEVCLLVVKESQSFFDRAKSRYIVLKNQVANDFLKGEAPGR